MEHIQILPVIHSSISITHYVHATPRHHAPRRHVPPDAAAAFKKAEHQPTQRHQGQAPNAGVEPPVPLAEGGAEGRRDDLGEGVAVLGCVFVYMYVCGWMCALCVGGCVHRGWR
jgi:hypothetical protein